MRKYFLLLPVFILNAFCVSGLDNWWVGRTFTAPFPYPYRFNIVNDSEIKLEWTEEGHYLSWEKSRFYNYGLVEDAVFIRFLFNGDLPVNLWEGVSRDSEPWDVGHGILGLFGVVDSVQNSEEIKVVGVTYAQRRYLGSDIFTVDLPNYIFDSPAQNELPLEIFHPSSELQEGNKIFQLDYINSAVSELTWVEGAEGNGTGESFEITFRKPPAYLAIINGFISAQNPSLYWKNGRIKTVRIEGLTTGTVIERKLEDTPHLQTIDIRELGDETHARFVIADVYPGECYADTCLHFMSYSDYPLRPLSHPWRRNE